MNLSCVNRFPPFFFFFFSPSSSSVDVSLVLQDHLSRILSSLLLHQIPPMLLGELSVSRICQSEPYSRGIAAFSPFDPFDPSSYSLSSLILAIHVFSWTWDTWVVILLDGSRVWERLFHRALKFHGCRLRDRDEESIYHIYIHDSSWWIVFDRVM